MEGRDSTDGFTIRLTKRWSDSGYGGLGPGGHFTSPLIIARCKLPPCSFRAYSKGDIPYLKQHCVATLLDIKRSWDYEKLETGLALSKLRKPLQ